MSPEEREGRPRQDAPRLADSGSILRPVDPLDEVAERVRGTFVVVVETRGGGRRRCYLTTAAAEAAVRRAEAAGHQASAFIAALQPLWQPDEAVDQLDQDAGEG